MACYRDLQQPAPTPGWALQYTPDFKPAWGRTYEPAAVSPHVTVVAVERMLDFYRLTGDRSFLARLNEALRADPSLANSDPLANGWFFKVKLAEPAQVDALLDETAYNTFAAGQ